MSVMNFACPSCKKVLKSLTTLAPGKVIKCPVCHCSFAVPPAGQTEGIPQSVAAPPPPTPAPPPSVAQPPPVSGGSVSGGLFDILSSEYASPPPKPPSPIARPVSPPLPVVPALAIPDVPTAELLPEPPVARLVERGPLVDTLALSPTGRDDDADMPEYEVLDDDALPRINKGQIEDVDFHDQVDVPPRKKKRRDDDDDLDREPPRKKNQREEDVDDLPEVDLDDVSPRKKKATLEPVDDLPRKISRARVDEEEDDFPRRKKKESDEGRYDAEPVDELDDDDFPRRPNKGRDDDDGAPRRARNLDEDSVDEDSDDRAPVGRKRARRGKKLLVFSLLVIVLAGLGVGGWYAWPLLSGGFAPAGMSYLPPDCDEIWGINIGPLEGNSGKKPLRVLFHDLDLDFFELDSVIEGSNKNCYVRVEQLRTAVDVDRIRKKLHLGPAETIGGQAVYRDRRGVRSPHDVTDMVFSPNSKTCVLGSVSEFDLKQMLSRSWPANSRDMLAQVKKVQGSGVWSVVSLDAPARPDFDFELGAPDKFAGRERSIKVEMCVWLVRLRKADKLNDVVGRPTEEGFLRAMADMRTHFTDVKTVTFTAQPADAKSLKLEARIDFANEGDAKAIEAMLAPKESLKKFARRLVERGGGTFVARLAQTYGSYAAKEAESSLAVKTDGASLIISATLTELSFNALFGRLETVEREEKERKNFEP